MDSEKVSVIIPAYNNETYIEKCLQSVTEQSYENLEILVINDGSSDRTEELIREAQQQDKRIQLFTQKNSGVSVSRNRGIDTATGDYLTFVDADDYIGKDYIRDLVNLAEEKDADLVICGLKMVDEQGKVLQDIVPGEYRKGSMEEWTFRISAVCSHLYKRELWMKYDIRFATGVRGEDMPISLFFSGVTPCIQTLPQSEYYYVQHASSAMHSFQGLKTYKLPYQAVEEAVIKARQYGICNSEENFELFALRIMATFIQLAKGASKEDIREVSDYIYRMIKAYFPEYRKNSLVKLNSKVEVPFMQKMAVWSMIKMVRVRALYPFLKVVCRSSK